MTQIDNWEEKHINKVLAAFEKGTGEKDAHPAMIILKVGFRDFLLQKLKETITLAKREERKRIVEEIDDIILEWNTKIRYEDGGQLYSEDVRDLRELISKIK